MWFQRNGVNHPPENDPRRWLKEVLEDVLLTGCAVCGCAPRETRRVVNLNSDTQQKIVLYELLKLPKKYAKNEKGQSVLKSDEATLKGLLGGLPT